MPLRIRYFMVALLAAWTPVRAQEPSAEFYRGKTLTFMINFTVGGSTDLEGRVWARHLRKHIPGNPNVVVQNMGGAGGTIGANWLAQVARPDGLTLGYLTGSTGKQALGETTLIDMNTLSYLGNSPDVNLTYARRDIPPGLKNPLDIMKAMGINHCCGANLTLREAAASAGVALEALLDALDRPVTAKR